jgi:hypothetical protein
VFAASEKLHVHNFKTSLGIDITLSVNQAGRGLTDKPYGDRYQFHAKMSEKSAIFLRQAICITQWCSRIYSEIILIFLSI